MNDDLEQHTREEQLPMTGLMADAVSVSDTGCEASVGCITCGDVAVALTVLRLDQERGLALCADGDGRSETVQIDLVAPVGVGDRLLVHAGTAIARLAEEVGR